MSFLFSDSWQSGELIKWRGTEKNVGLRDYRSNEGCPKVVEAAAAAIRCTFSERGKLHILRQKVEGEGKRRQERKKIRSGD